MRPIKPLTDNSHDDGGLPRRYLLHEGEDLVDDEPLVEVREELAEADEAVDAHRQQRRRHAQLLDPRQQRVLHGLVVEQPYKLGEFHYGLLKLFVCLYTVCFNFGKNNEHITYIYINNFISVTKH